MNTNGIQQEEAPKLASLCRTCMSSSETPLTSLFGVLTWSEKDESLSTILYKCTSIQVGVEYLQ